MINNAHLVSFGIANSYLCFSNEHTGCNDSKKLEAITFIPLLFAYCFSRINQQNVKASNSLHLSTPVWNDVWFSLKYI